ncbi:hypothetical protein RO3G_07291 [Lichtheimia corymbifera JMRC:FSU:9682]|uniref:BZIP domain-containing protein n=1 Tax=Lichtheimia corymbifera JMRC:FSU:9682 TaxID=1263082 RepID=A0A068SEZ8_9FUNG|nr:hypothetical protein RO3G_07291 [Lichtheimia corymbifera JMRC:FSU:9682]
MSTTETTSADTPMNNDELANALLQKVPATTGSNSHNGEQPVKIRKKPGRKPNPASPALRKAQNRAAQRAFRERKERHLRELEATVKQMREEREQLQAENEQLKHDSDVLKSENWYLKGIVLTLQLVCYRHNLVIPQHSPYMNEEALGMLAQSIPEPIAAYISANANNKLPIPSRWQNNTTTPSFELSSSSASMAPKKPRNRFLSQGSIVITKDGIQSLPKLQEAPPRSFPIDNNNEAFSDPEIALPALSPVMPQDPSSPPTTTQQQQQPIRMQPPNPPPSSQHEDTITSNLAAIQILRLRLRLQSVCQQIDTQHFAIQPTVLQLTIPHDPRIDLIPTPHMRDRMILFRDLFDLDDCLRCLIGNSTFHGGDPAVPSNWQLPPEFFDKFWFLTTDFSLQRITNKWRKAQGLDELQQQNSNDHVSNNATGGQSLPDMSELASFFFPSTQQQQQQTSSSSFSSSSSSSISSKSSADEGGDVFCSPIQLTHHNGYTGKRGDDDYTYGDIVFEDKDVVMGMDVCPPWDDALMSASPTDQDYDTLMESLIHTENE